MTLQRLVRGSIWHGGIILQWVKKNVVFVFDCTGFFYLKSHEQRVGTGECLWVGKMTAPERIASDLLLHR
jgi:hypothetical protein